MAVGLRGERDWLCVVAHGVTYSLRRFSYFETVASFNNYSATVLCCGVSDLARIVFSIVCRCPANLVLR